MSLGPLLIVLGCLILALARLATVPISMSSDPTLLVIMKKQLSFIEQDRLPVNSVSESTTNKPFARD